MLYFEGKKIQVPLSFALFQNKISNWILFSIKTEIKKNVFLIMNNMQEIIENFQENFSRKSQAFVTETKLYGTIFTLF